MQVTPIGSELSAFGEVLLWITTTQAELHQSLVAGVSAIRDAQDGSTGAALALIGLGFTYGVFHAAGPGHGKAVLASWLATNPASMKRGMWLALGGALCQGLVAILLVGGLMGLAGLVPSDVTNAVSWSERASYFMVAGIGGMLLWGGAAKLWRQYRPAEQVHNHSQDQHHDHTQSHGHDHDHQCCGHNHAPSTQDMDKAAAGPLALLAIILSMGLRPCTGAILLLIFTALAQILWVGMIAVIAMSLGTALTVAALALVTVKARDLAVQLATRNGRTGNFLTLALILARGGAGLLLLAIGLGLLANSFAPSGHALGL